MFGPNVVTAVQDPSYPVYVDTSVMLGQTGALDEATRQYENIVYMPCTPDNQFFPNYAEHPRADVVYLCSPKYVHIPIAFLARKGGGDLVAMALVTCKEEWFCLLRKYRSV